jgi:hypothetical protein
MPNLRYLLRLPISVSCLSFNKNENNLITYTARYKRLIQIEIKDKIVILI